MLTAVQEQLSEIRNIQGQIARSHEREKEMVADLERCRAEAVPLKEREAKVVQNLSSERGWRQVQGDKLGRELLADDPLQRVNRWDDPAVRALRDDLLADLWDRQPSVHDPRLELQAPV